MHARSRSAGRWGTQPDDAATEDTRVPQPSATAHATRTRRAAPAAVAAARSARQRCAELPPVPSTLLIPLAARARGGAYFPWLDCGDTVAPALLERLGTDVQAYLDDLPTVLNVLWRTRAIRALGQAFFAQHPRAWGANLGCGLTHYFQWLDTGHNHWLDADLPPVMALRQLLLPPANARVRQAAVDLGQPGWWKRLALPEGPRAQPVLLVCEGVLMYLQPVQVQAVLVEFAEHAPAGSRMVLDVLTRQAVGQAARHASVGPTGAQFCWGVGRMAELAQAHPRLALLHEQSVLECYGWPGIALDMAWRAWLGAPLYGLATLGAAE
ncbi:class I SAM-dependent methyltransferase [Paracidovorax sp. MALMAid1276]|uniref:class I SAM-dependent methyltransferase n=1 Tax=Paracidovorax sp. MALMAid1276 TaxID=3411631 RepID=UPI003B9A4BF6